MTLLAVRPHPDDESTSTGGMLAYYGARDVRTGVVICTGSEGGEIHDPELDPVVDRPRLRELRTQEVEDACAILGVAELRMLGYDTGPVQEWMDTLRWQRENNLEDSVNA